MTEGIDYGKAKKEFKNGIHEIRISKTGGKKLGTLYISRIEQYLDQ